jgi:putative sigma-54 modulation protein
MDISDAMRDYIQKKVDRLNRYFDRLLELEVVMTADNEAAQSNKAEIIAKPSNHERFVVQAAAEDPYAALDEAVDKMERRLSRWKERTRNDRKHRTGTGEASQAVLDTQAAATAPEEPEEFVSEAEETKE